jgi:hypothetical protein
MKYIFGIIGAIFNAAGAVGILAATSVMGEIGGLILILIGTLSLGVGGILSKLDELKPRTVITQWPTKKEEVIELTDCISG